MIHTLCELTGILLLTLLVLQGLVRKTLQLKTHELHNPFQLLKLDSGRSFANVELARVSATTPPVGSIQQQANSEARIEKTNLSAPRSCFQDQCCRGTQGMRNYKQDY